MADARYVSAEEASRLLRVSTGTLYSYVSRGLVRSEPISPNGRERRYLREDVEQLQSRKELRRNPGQAAQQALRWGQPVLESGITLVADGRCYYRGHDVAELARSRTFEEVAGLIWRSDFEADLFAEVYELPAAVRRITPLLLDLPPLGRFQAVLAVAQEADPQAFALTSGPVASTGSRILRLLATTVKPGESMQRAHLPGVAEVLQRAWVPGDGRTRRLFDAALVCMADHELNVSSFTARCVASAGAGPYQVIAGGLAALQGWRHGGAAELAAQMLREAEAARDLHELLLARVRLGQHMMGFGQQLYPAGDPRATVLFELMEELYPRAPELTLARRCAALGEELTGEKPNIDFALGTLCLLLKLKAGSGITLFALGRTVGWIGHALEQYALDVLIRPRARYTGVLPVTLASA